MCRKFNMPVTLALILALIFCQNPYQAVAQSQESPTIHELPPVAPTLPPPPVTSRDLHINQFHYVYSTVKNGAGEPVDVVTHRYPLSQIDVSNPPARVFDFDKEIRFVHDPAEERFLIQRVVYDEPSKRMRVTDAHVFENFRITSNIATNSNEIIFNEKEGVRAILMKHLRASFCSKPIVSPVVLPPASIKKIEFQNPEISPDALVNEGRATDGDLRVHFANGEVSTVRRSEIIQNLATGLLGVMAQVLAANPNLDDIQRYQRVFKDNAADLAEYNRLRERTLEGPYNDAVVHALRAIGQKIKFEELGVLFEKDAGGRNEFNRLIQAARDSYDLEAWMGKSEVIAREREAVAASGGVQKPWRQVLLDHLQRTDPEIARLTAQTETRYVGRAVSRIQTAFDRIATRRNLIITASVLSAIAVNAAMANTPVHWMVAGVTQVLRWSTDVPLLGHVTEPIYRSLDFYSDPPSRWAVLRLVFGATLVLMLNPLSYAAGKMAAMANNKNWDGVKAFFTYGTRAYGHLNQPLHRLVWSTFLYHATVENNVDPFKHPVSLATNFASSRALDAKARTLNAELNAEAVVKGRASLIAAAIVCEVNTKNGNPIDIATLIMAGSGESIARFEHMFTDAALDARWSDITQQVYKGLVAIGDHGGQVSAEEVNKYIEIYQRVASRVQTEQTSRSFQTLRDLVRRARSLMSAEIIPFLLFGKQLYQVSERYKNAIVHPQTSEIAKHNYNEDYRTSTYIYAAADPLKFADIAVNGFGAPEIISNQLSQVFVYGVQGAIDPPDPKEGLRNPFPPLSEDFYSGLGERQQTSRETFKGLLRRAFQPGEPSYFGQHLSVMQKSVEGFQVRFAADFFSRAAAAFIILQMMGVERPLVSVVLSTAIASTYFLFAKIAFQASENGIVPGYATVWPYIQMAMKHMQLETLANARLLRQADFLMFNARENRDASRLSEAVNLIKEMYSRSEVKLPLEFAVPTETYTFELAEKLHSYRLTHPPLPTKISEPFAKWINRFGAVASTALYTSVSAIAVDLAVNPNANPELVLIRTLTWFGITAGVLAVTQVTVNSAIKGSRAIVDRVCSPYFK